MNANSTTQSGNEQSGAKFSSGGCCCSYARGALFSFAPAALALCAVAALALLALFGDRSAGAKEPVQVAVRPYASPVLAAAALGADDKSEPGTGTFKGVVTFKGKPPAPELLHTKNDPKVKEADRAICAAEDYFSDELLVNEKAGNGVANVVIYLQKAPDGYKAPPPPEEPFVFDQKGCRFMPHVKVIRCNQPILIKSGDALLHNTHISPFRNPEFNQAISANNRDGVPYMYKKPERTPMPIKCDLHSWMKAYQLPLEHPFAAVTDEEGKFEIKGLPPGKHTFIVWHELPGYLKKELPVEIKADKPTEEKLLYGQSDFFKK